MFKELKSLLPFARRYLPSYLAGLVCLLLTDAGELYIPVLIKKAIDIMTSGVFTLSAIGRPMGLMVLTALFVGMTRFGWRYFIIGSSRKIERDIREKLFSHLLTLSPSYYASVKTGDIMARATNDVRAVRRAAGMALVAFIDGTFLSVAIITILIYRYGSLALITILPLPFITLIILFAGRLIRKYFKSVQEGFSLLTERARETIAGIRIIKAFSVEDFFRNKFRLVNEDYKTRNMKLVRLWGFFFPVMAFISGLSVMLLLLFGGTAVINRRITPGDFVAMISYLTMLRWPLMGMGFTVNMLQRGAASMARINEVLNTEPDITSPEKPEDFSGDTSVEIRNLSYTFPGSDTPVFENLSLSVDRGKTLGILGRTGSGKSTLTRFLPRLIDPPAGTVFIGDVDVRDFDLETLRKTVNVVPQDTFLFSATIRENIIFGKDGISGETISEVSEITTISRDLKEFPRGMDTEVGERGVTLSGGQKQRIALARALAADPPVLVMDDSFSSVDTRTEKSILNALLKKRKGKTSIIISHRVGTLIRCDTIAVIDRGRVIQQGTHEELIAEEGLYREIAVLQGEA